VEFEGIKCSYDVQFEVLTAVTVKSAVFFVVTLCSSDRTRCFEGTFASIFRVEDFQAASPNHTALQSVLFLVQLCSCVVTRMQYRIVGLIKS
jgi:hypothetical protein